MHTSGVETEGVVGEVRPPVVLLRSVVRERVGAEIVDRFRRGLEARGIRPQKIILYGSHATGVATAVSDIDVVVISSDFFGWDGGESFVVDFARNGEVLYAA
ncbi:MAG: nucleotidyltransferase domain-containing protein [Acidobacteriota bacterium]